MKEIELKIWCENNLYNSKGYTDGNKLTESWYIRNNYKNVYIALISFKEKHNLSKLSEVAYWLKHNITEKPKCLICNTPLRFYGRKGYSKVCGKGSCKATYHEQVMMEKYGTTNYAKTNEFKNTMISKRKDIEKKKKQTCLEKYGVDNPMKDNKIKKKLENKMIETFGVKTNLMCLSEESIEKRDMTRSSTEFRKRLSMEVQNRHDSYSKDEKEALHNKSKETLIKTFGSLENAYKEKHERAKKTFVEKYGVENPQQNPEIHEKTQKNRYNFKEFKMPSGKIVKVQGYEDKALNYIFNNSIYSEDQIELRRKEMPEIWYDDNGVKRRYFPDIYIESENKIIEVKSIYTMESNIDTNNNKKYACIDNGYNFEFWIFDNNSLKIT